MGLIASEWVIEALNVREKEKKQAPRLHMSQPELVVRMSSARPPRKKPSLERRVEQVAR
jgi:hypothetical protein